MPQKWTGEEKRQSKVGWLDHRSFVPARLAARTPTKAGRRPHDIRRFWLERLVAYVTVMSVALVGANLVIPRAQQRAAQSRLISACGLLQPLLLIRGLPLCTHGSDPTPQGGSQQQVMTSGGAVLCYDDGNSGQRVEVLYAHTPSVASRLNQYASQFNQILADTDGTFNVAANAAGQTRHVRYVTDNSCHAIIHDFTLASDGADTFGNTIRDLSAAGYNRSDRHYLIFVDSSVYCGIASLSGDDRLVSDNNNNRYTNYARVDNGCWGVYASTHELVHTFGGVQLSAQHSSQAYHCYDGNDIECYADGGAYFTNGGKMQTVCSGAARLDCNSDDYFNANPPAGNYLATHWDVAQTSFFDTQTGSTTSPGPPNHVPSLPGPPPPTTTVTHVPPTTRVSPPTTTKRHCTLLILNCKGG